MSTKDLLLNPNGEGHRCTNPECPICHSSKNTKRDKDYEGQGYRFSCDICNASFWKPTL